MRICEVLQLQHPLLQKYEPAATATREARADLFTPQTIWERANRLQVSAELLGQICQFIARYGENEAMLGALDLFYYVLFESGHEFGYISEAADIERPAVEKELDGVFDSILLMAAEVHYAQVCAQTGLDLAYLEAYRADFQGSKALVTRVQKYFQYGYAKPTLFHLGRLNYELRPCVADCRIARKNDPILTVHIPGGRPLLPEEVQASLREAKEKLYKIFAKQAPRGLMCRSWLMDPQIRAWLPEGSNIKKFQDLFEPVDNRYDCTDSDFFVRIFNCQPCPLEQLQPKNEFQRRALEHVKNGGRLYVCLGILKDQ